MMQVVERFGGAGCDPLVRAMQADRKQVFVDRLGWEVPHEGGLERDEFDDGDAVYLILRDGADGGHLGSVRLLRTDRRHLLDDVFPELCEGPAPRGPALREITRLCVSPRCPPEERRTVTRLLMTSLVEHALLCRVEGYTMMTDVGYLQRVAAAGWRCEALGMPRQIGSAMVAAIMVHVDAATPGLLRRAGTWLELPDARTRLREAA